MNCTKEESWEIVEKYWEREWEKIKLIDFPLTREFPISFQSCVNEISSLHSSFKSNKTPSKIIIKYHPSMRYANRKNCLSPFDYWQQLKVDPELFKKFYENRLRCSDWFKEKNFKNFHHLKNGYVPEFIYGIGLSTSRKASFVSYFKPSLAKNLISKYLNSYSTIFDPCSGYSGRMLGAMALDKNYIGYDFNSTTISEARNIYKTFMPYTRSKVELYSYDSLWCKGSFSCLFTCTPYSDIESWKDINTDKLITSTYSCDEWIDLLIERYDCEKYLFVVDDTIIKYRDYIVEELENTSHFGKNKEYVVEISK